MKRHWNGFEWVPQGSVRSRLRLRASFRVFGPVASKFRVTSLPSDLGRGSAMKEEPAQVLMVELEKVQVIGPSKLHSLGAPGGSELVATARPSQDSAV
jgi:hypothetical protein